MSKQKLSFSYALILLVIIALLLGACSQIPAANPPAEPSRTSISSTATPVPAAPTMTSIPPTEAPTTIPPTPRSTTIPGTKLTVTTEELKVELEVHPCNMRSIGYGNFTTDGIFDGDVRAMMDLTEKIIDPARPFITPRSGDDIMCWMKGEVLEGTVSVADVNGWMEKGTVFLLDQVGKKSDLVYAGVNPEEQIFILLFSTKYSFMPAQIQMLNALVDLP